MHSVFNSQVGFELNNLGSRVCAKWLRELDKNIGGWY